MAFPNLSDIKGFDPAYNPSDPDVRSFYTTERQAKLSNSFPDHRMHMENLGTLLQLYLDYHQKPVLVGSAFKAMLLKSGEQGSPEYNEWCRDNAQKILETHRAAWTQGLSPDEAAKYDGSARVREDGSTLRNLFTYLASAMARTFDKPDPAARRNIVSFQQGDKETVDVAVRRFGEFVKRLTHGDMSEGDHVVT